MSDDLKGSLTLPGDAEIVAKAEDIREKRAREIAQDAAPEAVNMLVKIMKGQKLPGDQRATPPVMRQAAMDVLTQAHGRPETRDPRVGGQAGGGLTIVINKFSSGEPPREIPISRELSDALSLAEKIQERSAEREPVDAGQD